MVDATGNVIYTAPPKPPAAVVPRETVTTTTRDAPRRPIWRADELADLTKALPAIQAQVLPKFTPPSSLSETVTMPDGSTRTGAQILKKAEQRIVDAYRNMGIEVVLRWEPSGDWFGSGGQFKIVRAWEAAKRQSSETSRVTGSPRPMPEPDDGETEE